MTEATSGPLLLIDDDVYLLEKLKGVLEAEGYAVNGARSPEEALTFLAAKDYLLVITDLSMPGTEGLSIYESIREVSPSVPVIILTGRGSAVEAARATKMGCSDYLRKPIAPDELKFRVQKAIHQFGLEAEVASLRSRLKRTEAREMIVGASAPMRLVLDKIAMVATSELTVLIRGETGTGKELVAKAIHNTSLRAKRPFIEVVCAAIPQTLLEGQLFGHKRGSFTGADRDQKGLIQLAENGTLFLDEIGELDAASQVKLLRVLESRELRPLGDEKVHKVNVRVIAATNLNIEQAIERERFRSDLFYRLNVFPITLPPLREHKEDIPLLARHFAELHGPDLCGKRMTFSPEAIQKLVDYDWPGNVRELESKVCQAILAAPHEIVSPSAIDLAVEAGPDLSLRYAEAKKAAVDRVERRFVRELLARTNGAISEAASIAGLHRNTFWRLMKKHGIHAGDFRT